MAFAQVVVNGAVFGAERLSNLGNGKAAISQGPRARRCCLRGAFLASGVNALFFRGGDADGLPFPYVLMLNLRNTEQDTGNQVSNRAAEVDLLRNRDNPDAALTPVGHDIDAIPEIAGQAVELPDDNGVDRARENSRLQFLESRALQMLSRFAVFEPMDSFVPVPFEPRLQLGALAIGLLAFRGGYADINAGGHANMGTPYFA